MSKVLTENGIVMKWQRCPVTYLTLKEDYTVPEELRFWKDCSFEAWRMHPFKLTNMPEWLLLKQLKASLKNWEAVCGIAFAEVTEIDTANIILGTSFDGDCAGFSNYVYNKKFDALAQGYICLDPREPWFPGWKRASPDIRTWPLEYTLTHELGHNIGLVHTEAPAVMHEDYDPNIRGLVESDILAAQSLYGPTLVA